MGEQNVEAKKSKQKVSPKLTAAEVLPRRSTHSNTAPEVVHMLLTTQLQAPSGTISDGYGDHLVEEWDESNEESKDGSISEYEGEEEGRIDGLELADGDEIDEVAEAKAVITHLSQQLKATQAARVDQFGLENQLKRVVSQSFDVGVKHKRKKHKQGILKLPDTAKLRDHIKKSNMHTASSVSSHSPGLNTTATSNYLSLSPTCHIPSGIKSIQWVSSDSSIATTIPASLPSTPPPTGLKPGAPPNKL
ncbi:hypothetical protein BU17DRAFT_68545 [Hysterangium stoloniferum]|nr:hypothetical protein BU17DRAFT_68545 [Hysterangium stoloniferum]